MASRSTKYLNVKFTPQEMAALEQHCRGRCVPMTAFLRQLVRDAVPEFHAAPRPIEVGEIVRVVSDLVWADGWRIDAGAEFRVVRRFKVKTLEGLQVRLRLECLRTRGLILPQIAEDRVERVPAPRIGGTLEVQAEVSNGN